MKEFFDFIKLIASSNGGTFAITGGFIWFVLWVYGKFVKMTTKHEGFESCCKELNSRVTSVEKNVNEIKGEIQYIKSTLNALMNMQQNATLPVMQSHSPLSLTDLGKQLAAGFNADAIVNRNFTTIKAKIDSEVVAKTPYDVQTYCLEKIPVFPENYLDAEALNTLKDFAFNNGRTLFECLKIVGLKARDAYFASTGIEPALTPNP
jgi:hypothetical protein